MTFAIFPVFPNQPGRPHPILQLKKQIFFLLLMIVASVWVLFQLDLQNSRNNLFFETAPLGELRNNQESVPTVAKANKDEEESLYAGFIINTPGCRIQYFNTVNPIIEKFIHDEHLNCWKSGIAPLLKRTLSTIYIDKGVVNEYSNTSSVSCCYEPMLTAATDAPRNESERCKRFEDSIEVQHDYVNVTCDTNGKKIYQEYFAFFKKNEADDQGSTTKKNISTPNILMIGLDSVSRLNLHRQMPLTVQFFKARQAQEMVGYNKVEDNTFPNLIPVLTGLNETELKESCWPSTRYHFDNCQFIWKKCKELGYTTGFGEDAVKMGLFNYLKRGFLKKPTDVFLEPFIKKAEHDMGHKYLLNANLCIGNKPQIEVLFESILNFVVTRKEEHFFGFFWGTSLTHDFLNFPRIGDKIVLQFLETLESEGVMNNTVVIFMSDHGIRWGDIRTTYQGYIEERLPFLFFLFPPQFKSDNEMAIANLRMNQRRLTTPFDLHETINDLIDPLALEPETLRKRVKNVTENRPRGQSLFLAVSKHRNCPDAGIAPQWCSCQEATPISVNATDILKASHAVLLHINLLLKPYTLCAQLTLNSVKNAVIQNVYAKTVKDTLLAGMAKDYIVTIETFPGLALFQANVRYENKKFTVLPPVSRINTYGSQSGCIFNYNIRLYCFCK